MFNDFLQIQYQTLESNKFGDEHVNVYGVIVDAQYPVLFKDKWTCVIKVVDGSWHTTGSACVSKNEFKVASITIYAKRFEDCPLVGQIGDIIRVHHATFRSSNDLRKFTVNVHSNSSWCLFQTKASHALDDSDSDEEMYGQEE